MYGLWSRDASNRRRPRDVDDTTKALLESDAV